MNNNTIPVITLTASQQTALEVLDTRIANLEQSVAQQLIPLQERRAAVLAELGLTIDINYKRDGAILTILDNESKDN